MRAHTENQGGRKTGKERKCTGGTGSDCDAFMTTPLKDQIHSVKFSELIQLLPVLPGFISLSKPFSFPQTTFVLQGKQTSDFNTWYNIIKSWIFIHFKRVNLGGDRGRSLSSLKAFVPVHVVDVKVMH